MRSERSRRPSADCRLYFQDEETGAKRKFWSLWKSVKVWGAHLCPTLCDPMDCSLPGSSLHGILQQEY